MEIATPKSLASPAKLRLSLEFLLLFAGVPLLILAFRQPGILFLTLWLGGLMTHNLSRTAARPAAPSAAFLRGVLLRVLILGAALTLVTRLAMPAHILDLPRHRPILWLAIMILYPVLSVWPQEVIYRRFLFHRYAALFPTTPTLIAASALAFSFAHVIFLNWIAIGMTAAGGALFAADYASTNSLRLACLEHSLYGCLIFTIGLGRDFYTAAAWHP